LRVAAERQQEMMAGKAKEPATIETTAQPVPERQREGANSPASIPIPGAPFAAAK